MTHQQQDTEGAPLASPAAPRDLAAQLGTQRAVEEARRYHRRATRLDRALHRIGLADVREQAATAARQRRERRRDAREQVELAELYRRAEVSGARARTAARIQQSAEVRALRIGRVRSISLKAGLPVLAAFAAWSTAGVHRGVTTVLGLPEGSPGWWAAWGVEPALISIVALVILGRAWLRSAGGDVDWRASAAEWSALSASILLNLAGAGLAWSWSVVPDLVAHSIGPAGCAATAWLIATFDSYVRAATPFEGAPTLESLGITRPRAQEAPTAAQVQASPVERIESDGGSVRSDTPVRTGSDPVPEPLPAPAEAVPQLGTHRSMDQLQDELIEAVRSGELDRCTADRIVEVLKVGKARARKLRDWAEAEGVFSKERSA